MTQLRSGVAPPVRNDREKHPRWPLTAVVAGAAGLPVALDATSDGPATLLVWAAVAGLLVMAAAWRRWVEPRVRTSTAAYVVPLGLVASAAALLHGTDWVGWAGVALAAAGVAWMALRERTVSTWLGVVSLLPAAVTTLAAAGLEAGAAADVVGPGWLVAAGLGLALGRSTITR